MTNAELADEIERRRGGTDMLNSVLMPHQWRQIIAALRQPSPDLKAAYCEGYEDTLKDRQPSSDKVLVPRDPTHKMILAGYSALTDTHANWQQQIDNAYRAMLAVSGQEPHQKPDDRSSKS